MTNTQEPAVSLEHDIQWKQLWSLAALYASVIIGWIAYQNYQPRLLLQFEFTDFTFLLMAVQGVILVVTPAIAGQIGDRYRHEKGHRLPIISSGISLAAMVFMAVAFTLLGNPGEIFRWILPALIVLWLIAMSIFTSPALSTVELFTPVEKLPHAMAVLTITSNLVYALEPVIVDIIDYLGAPLTFMVGGVAVFASGYALKKNSLGLFRMNDDRETTSGSELLKSRYVFIFFAGLTLGTATTILFYLFPDLVGRVLGVDGPLVVVGVLLVSALVSWPISQRIHGLGLDRVFRISVSAMLVTSVAIYLVSSPIALVVLLLLFAVTYTTLSVSSLPLAINHSAFREKVFCVGIFFGGVALPEAVWEALSASSSL